MAGLWGPQIMAFYKAQPGTTHYRPRRGWGDWDSCDYKIDLRWCSLHLRFCLATGRPYHVKIGTQSPAPGGREPTGRQPAIRVRFHPL